MPSPRASHHLLLALVLLSGCVTRRSLLTPMPTLPTPAPTHGHVGVEAGARAATLIERQQPEPTDLVLVTPMVSLDASGTFRFGRVFALRPSVQVGFAQAATSGLGDENHDGAPTFGFAPGMSLRADLFESRLLLDFELDPFVGWTVERVESCTTTYGVCSVNQEDLHFAVFPRGAVTLSYVVDEWVVLHASVGAATQPVDTGVGALDVVGVAGAGAALTPIDEVAILLDVQWPFAGGPFTYGPTVAGGVRLSI